MNEGADEKFINGVMDALKRDANDLRKQQTILALYREATKSLRARIAHLEATLADLRAQRDNGSAPADAPQSNDGGK